MKNLFKISIFLFSLSLLSQTNTIGLQYYNEDVSDGYTLFSPETSNDVYLIDNCGEIINEWNFTELPGATCYLLENGNLLRAGKESIEIRDWNNSIVWTFLMANLGLNQHHDIEPLPNGNILCIITDIYSNTEMIAAGRDPSKIDSTFKLDKIIEIQPIGNNNAEIVWEWKFFDHLIQDFDNTKDNYGVVIEHPELLDINFDNGKNNDWTHVNGIDYNQNLNQIIISARSLSEIYIIDHSTSTSQASGHVGGNFSKGGDFLWRWGNPQVYRQGDNSDRKLFSQHDSKWVEDGYIDEGKISVFNNGGDGSSTFSSVHLISPEILDEEYIKVDNRYAPFDFDWSWDGELLNVIMYENKKSGAHSLPNGNFIICETSLGRISEISKNGDHLWTYVNPASVDIYNQYENPSLGNRIFRAEKYPVNYEGFVGQSLNPQGILENENNLSDICSSLLNLNNVHADLFVLNPIKNSINFNKIIYTNNLNIYDKSGRKIFNKEHFRGDQIKVFLSSGLYILQLEIESKFLHYKIIVE